MAELDLFLEQYGLPAVFLTMLAKAAGVPIPVPGDVILLVAAARAAEGKLVLWEAFAAILVALVAGGTVQFGLARGPGRQLVYRSGRWLGLPPARLDAAAAVVQQAGIAAIALAVLTPGVRSATIPACGLAGLGLRTFLPALALGSSADLGLHFLIGYLGRSLLGGVLEAVPWPWLAAALLLAAGLAAWIVIRRRQRPGAPAGQVVAEAVAAWEQATCPVCLALGQVRAPGPGGPRLPARLGGALAPRP